MRLWLLGAVFTFAMVIFVFRLADLQVAKGEQYYQKQKAGTSRTQVIKAARGEIVDRNGKPLTVNQATYSITFDKALEQRGETNNTIEK